MGSTWTEDFLAHDVHRGVATGEHGGFEVETVGAVCHAASADQAGTLLQGDPHFALDAVQALAVDQGAHLDIRLGQRVAVTGGGHGRADAFDELIGDLALHVDPLGTVADLTGVDDP